MDNNLHISNERSISHIVTETLKKAIFRGDLKLGERLVEANIAKKLNVSVTPVRQAFIQLAYEGLIHVYPFKGTYVVVITKKFIEDFFQARICLELQAVELALLNLTTEDIGLLEEYAVKMDKFTEDGMYAEVGDIDILFHRLFFERSGNAVLLELWSSMQSRIQLFQTYARHYNQSMSKGETQKRHMKIVTAVKEKDLTALLKHVKEHIENGKKLVIDHQTE